LDFHSSKQASVQTVSAGWIIGADGIHSKVREFLIPDDKPPTFTGNVAWRGLINTKKLKRAPEARVHLAMAPGAHLVFYYVRGGSLLNYVAVREQDHWQEESWTCQGNLKELLTDFEGWSPELLELLSQSNPAACYRWALHDRAPLASWGRDQCLIMGDAAHPMLPFLAQGAAMAIEDAAVITQCFQRYKLGELDGSETIAKIEKLRIERTARVQAEARTNMKLYHLHNPLIRVPRDISLSLLGAIKPNFMQRKMSWLYDHRI